MKIENAALRILIAFAMGLVISAVALKLTGVFAISEDSFFPSSSVTHTIMWFLSTLIILILTKGEIAEYGFTKGSYRLSPTILLWAVPTAVVSILGFISSRPGGDAEGILELSKLQDIVFAWVYASISEEVFTRGLLQGFLSPLKKFGFHVFRKWRLSLPVLFSGLYFGFMHIVLIGKFGPAVLFVIVSASLLGIVAGYYREKTGSLIPAIIIHALFNIGGMLPIWLLSWIF